MTDEVSGDPESELGLFEQRRAKLKLWREAGRAYPNDFRRDALAADLLSNYADHDEARLEAQPVTVSIAGRMMAKRVMGKASFIHLQDMSGRIQCYLQRDALGEALYQDFKTWDIGDIVAAEGELFRTRTGELSVRARRVVLLSKSLSPLPEKFHGLADMEARYRQRYLDLIMSSDSSRVFRVRAKVIQSIRDFLNSRGFLEVETPMMQPLPGGAAAKPFTTHHNALDMTLYLRVAPELYLKRLIVGGFEQVYEINRSFRNEGMSTRHNPEFTMLEFYQAYADYHDLMDMTELLLREVAEKALGTTRLSYQGRDYDLAHPFVRLSMLEGVYQENPDLDRARSRDRDYLAAYCKARGFEAKASWGWGKLIYELFEKTVETKLFDPTFIVDFPTEVSPLARARDGDLELTDRFELFIGGRELANGFSELNDPEDQAARFLQQAAEKAAGDDEAMYFDADYIRALEYAMPPTAGEGIGIDRLVMFLTDSASIRDVLLFPTMKLAHIEPPQSKA